MKKYLIVLFAAFGAAALSANTHSLVKKWETEASLKVPEGVLFDAARGVLYTSNIEGEPWADDGKGSIGKVGLDGKIIAGEWVIGLSAPKGMGLHGKLLYVGDMNRVVVVDVEKGAIVDKIMVEGSEGLNDVSVDASGVVYVTDSKAKRLYKIEQGKPSLYIDNLKGPNGVLAHKGSLYLLDGGALHKVEADRSLTLINGGMEGGVDGVENVEGNDFIVSCWAGVIHYIKGDGTRETLLDTREQKINTADIGYDAKKRIVYVPTFFKNSIVAYELK